eukprot:CAMPEP_0172756130 /NCGR_PEP_ID=MMETSP1074-20121228/161196_1 /TAXON_ID=2916 /ORGANISM="Ceratium fusus, Strain PA161109" /LENGTH=59 /DNA_ID=CAMNT_0013589339 /DNA_START=18 /DNA_END=194 /DNA_ORIENTATION=+
MLRGADVLSRPTASCCTGVRAAVAPMQRRPSPSPGWQTYSAIVTSAEGVVERPLFGRAR